MRVVSDAKNERGVEQMNNYRFRLVPYALKIIGSQNMVGNIHDLATSALIKLHLNGQNINHGRRKEWQRRGTQNRMNWDLHFGGWYFCCATGWLFIRNILRIFYTRHKQMSVRIDKVPGDSRVYSHPGGNIVFSLGAPYRGEWNLTKVACLWKNIHQIIIFSLKKNYGRDPWEKIMLDVDGKP